MKFWGNSIFLFSQNWVHHNLKITIGFYTHTHLTFKTFDFSGSVIILSTFISVTSLMTAFEAVETFIQWHVSSCLTLLENYLPYETHLALFFLLWWWLINFRGPKMLVTNSTNVDAIRRVCSCACPQPLYVMESLSAGFTTMWTTGSLITTWFGRLSFYL